jgi:hypothetical protein
LPEARDNILISNDIPMKDLARSAFSESAVDLTRHLP